MRERAVKGRPSLLPFLLPRLVPPRFPAAWGWGSCEGLRRSEAFEISRSGSVGIGPRAGTETFAFMGCALSRGVDFGALSGTVGNDGDVLHSA